MPTIDDIRYCGSAASPVGDPMWSMLVGWL
jgi:hypothetical protein